MPWKPGTLVYYTYKQDNHPKDQVRPNAAGLRGEPTTRRAGGSPGEAVVLFLGVIVIISLFSNRHHNYI